MNSDQYLEHCLEIMKADPNCSDDTKTIMFVEYANKVHDEKAEKSRQFEK